MALSVIGAGFGRTGTLSLKGALEQIGFGPCYHMLEVMKIKSAPGDWYKAACGDEMDWDAVFEGYNAAVDWPSCAFYRELAETYPDAKVILTLRDPKRWYESAINTIFTSMQLEMPGAPPSIQAQMKMARKLIAENTFGGDLGDEENAIAVFNAHTEEVKATIPAERLLVYEVAEGWEPLCAFLDVPVPDTPFPKVNTTEDFRAMIAARAKAISA